MNVVQQQEELPRTRCGYPPNEVIQSLEKIFPQAGTHATGRSLHFAADLVCSGGIQHLYKILWEHSLNHIGLASPRVFVYLNQRIQDIEGLMKTLPDEAAYSSEIVQLRIGEIILVLRDAPTRTCIAWPKVGIETHEAGWIRGAIVDPITESAALRRVWTTGGDFALLRTAGANISKAINEGSTERALFWIKWILEEDAIYRKANKTGLTSIERGPANLNSRQRTDVSFFILHLYSEMYKEIAAKGLIRMNEEFQTLINMWSTPPKGLGGGAKKQILVILTQILIEVPKWKVPAAPSLIKDPVYLSNAIKQIPKFFNEVLSYESPKRTGELIKAFKTRAANPLKPKVQNKKQEVLTQMEAYEKAMDAYLKK
jgi:hypothetical protein